MLAFFTLAAVAKIGSYGDTRLRSNCGMGFALHGVFRQAFA